MLTFKVQLELHLVREFKLTTCRQTWGAFRLVETLNHDNLTEIIVAILLYLCRAHYACMAVLEISDGI